LTTKERDMEFHTYKTDWLTDSLKNRRFPIFYPDTAKMVRELLDAGGYIAGGSARVIGRTILDRNNVLVPAVTPPEFMTEDNFISNYLNCYVDGRTADVPPEYASNSRMWKGVTGDVDFWFRTPAEAAQGQDIVTSHLSKIKDIWRGPSMARWADEFLVQHRIFQIITKIFDAPEKVVAAFDIANAACYLDKEGFHWSDAWWDLESNNLLGIQNSNGGSLIWRVQKWMRKHQYSGIAPESQPKYVDSLFDLIKRVQRADPPVVRFNNPVSRSFIKKSSYQYVCKFEPESLLLASCAYDTYEQVYLMRQILEAGKK